MIVDKEKLVKRRAQEGEMWDDKGAVSQIRFVSGGSRVARFGKEVKREILRNNVACRAQKQRNEGSFNECK